MTKKHLFLLMIMLGLSLCLSQEIQAQAVYGSISGTVTDASGAIIPDATVTIRSIERNTTVTATTNSDGFFSKERLLPGQYEIKVEKTGFKTGQTRGVTVSVDTQTKFGHCS